MMPIGGHGLARCMAQCASGVAGRRAVATYAIRPQERLLRELWSSNTEADCAPQQNVSQRDATAAVSRRQQWQTIPIEDCPRSLHAATQEPCREARIITESTHPYRVVFANHAWEELCGWTAEEVKGSEGLSFLQGPDTEKAKLKRINEAVKYGERVEVKLTNYKKDGTPFVNRLRVTPLTTSLGQYTHMLGILEEVPAAAAAATSGKSAAAGADAGAVAGQPQRPHSRAQVQEQPELQRV